MPQRLPPAVLLGGMANAVSVTRSLAAAGVHVVALGDEFSPVRWSRLRGEFHDLGHGEDVGERWLAFLRERDPDGAVVLACSDDGLELLARHGRELAERGYRPMEMNGEAVLTMLDKHRTYELAAAAGIPTPVVALPRTPEELEETIRRVSFPCLLKPRHASVYRRRIPGRGKLLVVADAGELRREHETLVAAGVEALVTEIVPGPDTALAAYVTYLDQDGRPLFELVLRKLRQYDPLFGEGSYRITGWDDAVAELGLRFLRAAGAPGLAYVEFKRDERTGQQKLIECNARFVAANELVKAACADPGLVAYRRALGVDPGVAGRRGRDGVRLWHPADDFLAFLAYRRQGELSFGSWARSLLRRQHLPVFRWDDPLPTLAWHLRGARQLARKRLRSTASRRGRA